VVSSAEEEDEDEASTRSVGVGAFGGREGRPSYKNVNISACPEKFIYLASATQVFFRTHPPLPLVCLDSQIPELELTSAHNPLNSSHISLGNILFRNGRLTSVSTISSSASRGWRGKDNGFDLQVFIAQVRKFRVRSFIFGQALRIGDGGSRCDLDVRG
jgi:hypothetical protein